MTMQQLYPKGRASALWSAHRTDYDLVAHLREVRASGDRAMGAAEEYDPNFGLKLSACFNEDQADRLLDEWFSHRVAVLKRTQARLRRVWEVARLQASRRR
jgi:hypothetical protein